MRFNAYRSAAQPDATSYRAALLHAITASSASHLDDLSDAAMPMAYRWRAAAPSLGRLLPDSAGLSATFSIDIAERLSP